MYKAIDFQQVNLTLEAPLHEPQRQYYFIARAREYVKEKEEALGRPLTAAVTTFGCQMNVEPVTA